MRSNLLETMRFNLFHDPRYNADSYVDFEPEDVASVQETMKHLFWGGNHRVTVVTLKNGAEYVLQGSQTEAIRAAQRVIS